MLFCFSLFAQEATRQPAMAPTVTVEQSAGVWRMAGQHVRVSIDTSTLQLAVQNHGVRWQMAAAGKNDLVLQIGDKRENASLIDAQVKTFSAYSTGFSKGVKIELSKFRTSAGASDLTVQLFLTLETARNELVCHVVPIEKQTILYSCQWPKPFVSESFDFTVVPFMQGMLLPRNWPEKVWLYEAQAYARGLYMPWWGHLQKNSAVLVLLETPDDGGCVFDHPAKGPTVIGPLWENSLGEFRYPRKLRMVFFDKGNYVDLAKAYRSYQKSCGRLVTLDEKVARTPAVAKLIGSPVLHTSILYHIQKESSYYFKNEPEKNHQLVTFAERSRQISELPKLGIDRLYIHLDGWGYRGYDNLHPDYLPPSPDAGGWEGMKKLVDTCKSLGYLIALHDQYRDYYLDGLSYDPGHAQLKADGTRNQHSTWYGGKQNYLCPSLAPGFVSMNHTALQEHGIRVDGSYLDVFAVVPPDECYSREHPVTRTACLNYRIHCFNIIKQLEGVVSSEEPADYAVPWLDLVHHGPYALNPNPGSGPSMGIPIPLFNLVYHDCIVLPWSIGAEKGGWGIPDKDSGYLHGLLNAGIPYMSMSPNPKELEKVRTVCTLHSRVGKLEMLKHEFLDSTYRKQRTVFSDGTTVTVDFDIEAYTIVP
jgi:hypothetical protein